MPDPSRSCTICPDCNQLSVCELIFWVCDTVLVTHADLSLCSFHPESSPVVWAKYFVLSCSVSSPFSLSARLSAALWPSIKQCWPMNALFLPCQESHAPCGVPKMDVNRIVSVTLKMGRLAWFGQTADTSFITDTATSLRTNDSAKRCLSDLLVEREHTHTHRSLFSLPPVLFNIWPFSGSTQTEMVGKLILSSSTHVIPSGLVLCGSLDGVGQKAEDSTDPQQDGEATKQLATEFYPFWSGGGWSQGVGAVPGQVLCCLGIGQTLKRKEWRQKKGGRWVKEKMDE